MSPFLDVGFPLFCGSSPRWPSSSRLCGDAPSPHRLPTLVLSLLALTRFLPSHPKVADSEEPCQMPVGLQTGHSMACLLPRASDAFFQGNGEGGAWKGVGTQQHRSLPILSLARKNRNAFSRGRGENAETEGLDEGA